jgi:hypothetical protein
VVLLKGKSTRVLKVPELVYCSFDANFKMAVIKHAEETNIFVAGWNFFFVGQKV